MEYQNYIEQKKELSDIFHQFIDNENSSDEDFQNFVTFLKTSKYEENADEFKLILHMINNVSNYHHRYPGFLSKIEQFLTFYTEHIKANFSNHEIFHIFQNNKRILLFLIEHQVIIVDEFISKNILKKDENKHIFVKYFRGDQDYFDDAKNYFAQKQILQKNYRYYFFPEIKEFLKSEQQEEVETEIKKRLENTNGTFDDNRHEGENETCICKLIREDSVKEFIIYVNQINFPLSGEIPDSIFETNPLLLRKRATLIEYAAFFGSDQIFKYLQLNHVKLAPSIWQYAIHGNNPEIIQILIDNHVNPKEDDFIPILQESIKCHHNSIANFILDNFISQEIEVNEKNFINNQYSFGFHYHNYEFIQNFLNHLFIFYYACLYDFFSIVKLLIKNKSIDLNHKVIQAYFLIKLNFSFIHAFLMKFQPSFNPISIFFFNRISLLFF